MESEDGVIGRASELGQVRELVRADAAGALVLTGAPGIGKTTLWEAGVDVARELGCRVEAAKAAAAESGFDVIGHRMELVGRCADCR